MLVLKLVKDLYSSTYIDIIDGTGVYDGTTNLGGFGVPNVLRNASNLGLVASLQGSDGVTNLPVTVTAPTNGTPINVTKWRIAITESGYVKIAMFIAPTYDNSISYTPNSIIWESTSQKFYYWNNTVSSVAGVFDVINGWVELKDASIVSKSTQTDVDGFYRVTLNDLNTESIKVAIAKLALEMSKEDECTDCTENFCKVFMKLTAYRIAAESLGAIGNYIKAQTIIEKANEIADASDSNCNC